MESPPIWSENLVRNFERIIEWSDAVALMCDLNPTEYEYYKLKEAWKIEYKDAQDVIISLSANFGSILDWITSGLKSINDNPRLPEMCIIKVVDLDKHSASWKRHVNEERQILDNLKRDILFLQNDAKKKLQFFYEEESDEYSSYSDYSEDTSSSDEDDEDDNDDRESKEKRRGREKERSRDNDSRQKDRKYAKNHPENARRQSNEEEENEEPKKEEKKDRRNRR